jgi:cellulose synthase (UDP-forming)
MFKPTIPTGRVNRTLIIFNIIMAVVYFSWWMDLRHIGHPVFYSLLVAGELYHVVMAFCFWFTVWPADSKYTLTGHQRELAAREFALRGRQPYVDVYIPCAGEPVEVLRRTVSAAKKMKYSNFKIYILNDGFVAKKPNWKEVEDLATAMGVTCITRTTSGGAKAGNINNTLKQTSGSIIVIFDTDMAPHEDFLRKVIPYFTDKKVGFVQTPQYYLNHVANQVAGGAWEQQELFFGPIMAGKEKSNAAFICGTNVAIRRSALEQVGGMCEDNIAEDFLTSFFIHQNGWKSYYVPEVLAEGYAPEDLLSYCKQQLRWARGSLEVLFSFNPLLKRNMSWGQKIQYLSSALYYFNGVIIVIDALIPIVSLATGIQPVAGTTTSFAFFFLPFMFLNLYTLYAASGNAVTFRGLSFSMSSWPLQLQAIKSIVLRQRMGFAVTPKQAQEGNFLFLAYPHLMYVVIIIVCAIVGIYREGLSPSVITNITWGVFNVIMFIPFIQAACDWKSLFNRLFSFGFRKELSVK